MPEMTKEQAGRAGMPLVWEEESIKQELSGIPHRFLSVGQVARILQVNPVTVKRWIWYSKLAAFNTREDGKGHWRIAKQSLIAFIQERNTMNLDIR